MSYSWRKVEVNRGDVEAGEYLEIHEHRVYEQGVLFGKKEERLVAVTPTEELAITVTAALTVYERVGRNQ